MNLRIKYPCLKLFHALHDLKFILTSENHDPEKTKEIVLCLFSSPRGWSSPPWEASLLEGSGAWEKLANVISKLTFPVNMCTSLF